MLELLLIVCLQKLHCLSSLVWMRQFYFACKMISVGRQHLLKQLVLHSRYERAANHGLRLEDNSGTHLDIWIGLCSGTCMKPADHSIRMVSLRSSEYQERKKQKNKDTFSCSLITFLKFAHWLGHIGCLTRQCQLGLLYQNFATLYRCMGQASSNLLRLYYLYP